MIENLGIFIALFFIAFLYLKVATYFNIIDKPNKRSSHSVSTIRGGGILFFIAIILFFFFNDFQYPYFVLGVSIIAVVSFIDDLITLNSRVRFLFQLIAILLVLFQIGILSMSFLFFACLFLGLGTINMFNFMDGINGITGIYSLSVLVGLFLINDVEKLLNNNLIIYSTISLLVFGFYNFRKKALFFAGDIGSISIGMLIFFIGCFLGVKLSSPLILLLVVVYGADATMTILYRKFFTKESVFEPHRHHIYQKLVDVYKVPHLIISIVYSTIQVIINFIVYKTYKLEIQFQFIMFFGVISFFILLYMLLFRRIKNKIVSKNGI